MFGLGIMHLIITARGQGWDVLGPAHVGSAFRALPRLVFGIGKLACVYPLDTQ